MRENWVEVAKRCGVKNPEGLSYNEQTNYKRWYSEGVLEENLIYIVAYKRKRDKIAKDHGVSIVAAQEAMTTAEVAAGVKSPKDVHLGVYKNIKMEPTTTTRKIVGSPIVTQTPLILVGLVIIALWYFLFGNIRKR